MKNTRLVIIFFLTALILPASLWAYDFGLAANIYTGYGNDKKGKDAFEFRGDIWPRFSLLIGDNAEFFTSLGLSITAGYNEDTLFIPELLRTEFTMRFGNMGIRAGRMNYSDPLSFIAAGLFDGVQFYYNSGIGRFSAGLWYTGLLYKGSANITMTENDQNNYNSPLEYDDFLNTYFAPKRMAAAIDWSHPSLVDFLQLNAAVICQFDFNDDAVKYNSQYLTVKAGIPLNSFMLEAGGAVEISQTESEGDNRLNAAFAGDFGVSWTPPMSIRSRLSFDGKIAGGRINDSIGEFIPITTKYYGSILKHKMSGLSVFGLNYSARLNQEIGTSASVSYFIRNDLGTFSGYPLKQENENYFLGAEIFARVIWSPLSDMQFNFGGGAFFPSLGDAGRDEIIRWRVELTATLSLL